MIAVDTSVVVAAFSSWHEAHDVALEAVRGRPHLPAHAAIESYSVLTRLPAPYRASPLLVLEFLEGAFGARTLVLERRVIDVLAELAGRGIGAGATYDGLIALTAAAFKFTLRTLDRRALDTYARLGVKVELLERNP